ncbi:unnamed protein product, partial [Symbiodinium sp. CCMP2456]
VPPPVPNLSIALLAGRSSSPCGAGICHPQAPPLASAAVAKLVEVHADMVPPPIAAGAADRERPPKPRQRLLAAQAPGNRAMLRATQVKVLPDIVRSAPFFGAQVGTYSCVGFPWGTYAVFDVVRHHAVGRIHATATLQEVIATAVEGAPYPVSAVQILMDPVPHLPAPQIVLRPTSQQPGHWPVVWDLRRIGEDIFTILLSPGHARTEALLTLQRKMQAPRNLVHEVQDGALALADSAGIIGAALAEDLLQVQHVPAHQMRSPGTWPRPRPLMQTGIMEGVAQAGNARVTSLSPLPTGVRLTLLRGQHAHSIDCEANNPVLDQLIYELVARHAADEPLPSLFGLVLASAQPLRMGYYQEAVLLIQETSSLVTVWDGRHLGQELSTNFHAAGQHTHQVLPEAWRRDGWRLVVATLPRMPSLPTAAAVCWSSLPAWDGRAPLEAVYAFTDSSFFPGSACAGWSVVLLGLCRQQPVRIGAIAGTCEGDSAYAGGLRAIVYARAFALSQRPVPAVIGSDCTSALSVSFGMATFARDDLAARAAVGLALISTAFHQAVAPLHVRSHVGCAFNDLADGLAKCAAKGLLPTSWQFHPEVFWQGVREGVADWLWMLAPGFSSGSCLPPVTSQGTWTAASCVMPTSTQADPALFCPSPPASQGCAQIKSRVLQYNCLSLRGKPAQEMMSSGLSGLEVAVAMLQETRLSGDPVRMIGDHWVLSSPCDDQGPLQVGLVSGHAPFAKASADRRDKWWRLLTAQVRRIPRGCVLLAGLDANARFHAAGQDGAIDYVLCPKDWGPCLTTFDTPSLNDQQGFDHWPLLAGITASMEGSFAQPRPSISPSSLGSLYGQHLAAATVATLPAVTWDVDATTHVQIFHAHINAQLTSCLPKQPKEARHPAVSADTLELVRGHRLLRQ